MREEGLLTRATIAQRPLATYIFNPQEKVPRIESPWLAAFILGAERLAALHEGLPPAIGRRVVEDAKVAGFCVRQVASFAEREVGVEREGLRLLEPLRVVRKAERSPIVGERADARALEEVGIEPHFHLIGHGARSFGSVVLGRARALRRLRSGSAWSCSSLPTLSSRARASRSLSSPNTERIRRSVPSAIAGLPASARKSVIREMPAR